MAYTNPGPAVTTGDTNIGYGSPDTMGTSTSSLISFYGVTPIVQRSGAAQATSAEVMNTLTALGLWKGGA
jgi:hypothetical protein